MEKLCIVLLLSMMVASSFAQTVKFSSVRPEQGQPVKFVYDPQGGSLYKLANVTCSVKAISSRDYRSNIPVKLTKAGTVYEGEFTPKDSTNLVVLIFSADDILDENPNGYYTKFYKNGTVTPMSLFLEGHLFTGFGGTFAKIKTDLPLALVLYKQAFDADPKLQERYFSNYLLTQFKLDKIKGGKKVLETIALYNKLGPSEKTLTRIAGLYTIVNNKIAADSVYNLIKTNYPRGDYALSASLSSLSSLKGADNKEKRLNEILAEFNLDLNGAVDAAKVSRVFPGIGIAFLATKDKPKVEFYIDKIESKTTRAVLYYSFCRKKEEIKGDLPFFARISKKSLELLEAARQDEEPAEYYNSKAEYLKTLANSYILYAATYAGVLDLMGENSEALAFMEDAVTKDKFSTPEMNMRYVNLLVKNGKNEEATAYAERFIKAGQTNEELKNLLKAMYRGLNFNTYYVNLVKEADSERKIKFIKEMINIPAPKFALMNLLGQNVNLATLKGKVIIIDYWATWCGPCMLSFPSMQMAIEKYKNDPNVVFLFINTWQREENREKVVKDWIAANPKYTFNVLLDKKRTDDPAQFEVVDKYKVKGIPTKFIVDGYGNIRFRIIGFDGITEVAVKELDIMIDLAKGTVSK